MKLGLTNPMLQHCFIPAHVAVVPHEINNTSGDNIYPRGCYRIKVRMIPSCFETGHGSKIATSYLLCGNDKNEWHLFYEHGPDNFSAQHPEESMRAIPPSMRLPSRPSTGPTRPYIPQHRTFCDILYGSRWNVVQGGVEHIESDLTTTKVSPEDIPGSLRTANVIDS
ncbi:uncharacterized protein SPPG_09081 [Spizellomyces punctatus DAOM BR117]|uniref:Uncharacterized protein n=1 Tax=Spizellomyces punctatus (strain DAOM BR117) TaxID=645134 RepID=A0A0L0HKA7_SPIPD|nr:uncharacterized protein SPPG_09081 [Spizellomyces punctatus DAOM BR117]KND01259.1 hypothetical protein SPPG_09081 [Spizellomyces punctatus DAOM BR117]|eukprot:XP_016609298.1 hypothetical protein SPPG_09081 [Spizellomyces punctatus DAOM BR117]